MAEQSLVLASHVQSPELNKALNSPGGQAYLVSPVEIDSSLYPNSYLLCLTDLLAKDLQVKDTPHYLPPSVGGSESNWQGL